MSEPELSLLIVNYNSWRECGAALRSFQRHAPTRPDGSPMPYEAIVVDNASPQQPEEFIGRVKVLAERTGGCLIMHHENGGYSKGMNLAFGRARGRWLVISNPDVVFTPGCIDALLRYLEGHPDVACTVPRGWWDQLHEGRLPPNILPTMGDVLWASLSEYSAWARRRYGASLLADARTVWEAEVPLALRMMSGCLFVVERSTIAELGGLLDERYPLYYEDADLSVRIHKLGKRLVQVPDANLVHLYNRSGQTNLEVVNERNAISRRLYYRKWYGPPGEWILRATDWLRQSRLGHWLANRVQVPEMVDLGVSTAPPAIDWGAHHDQVLVQLSMDSRFYLAGAVYASGSGWSPSTAMFKQFGPYTFYLRALDISGREPVELGRWRYTYTGHEAAREAATAGSTP